MLRVLLVFALLSAPALARATDLRLVAPAGFVDDPFVKSLAESRVLAAVGLNVSLRQVANDAEAMAALKKNEADIGVFTLNETDRRALKASGAEATLLNRPFLFGSAQEVFLMQDSFLGAAAAADAGRSGLFPLKIWSHSLSYLLTRAPVRTEAAFDRLRFAPATDGAAMMKAHADALETRLDAKTMEMAKTTGEKLFLTVGQPTTGLLAAAPSFWMQAREIEKNALRTAAEQARATANAELMAREQAFRRLPNIEVNRLDPEARTTLAMRGGEGMSREQTSKEQMNKEMDLWHKAEVEVHGGGAAVPAAPRPKMATTSPVLFVTDRDDEGGPDYRTRFGARRLDPFTYSCAYLGAPARHSGEPRLPAAPKKLTTGLDDCARLIVKKTREAGLSKILVVIHGFNIPFDGLVWRALQLGSDLDYKGAIVGWSWPSEGSAFSYAYDEDSNLWSEPHLLDLVGAIAEAGPELQLDFVAHSMGGRMLLQMLRELALSHSNIRIGAAVFAAPDVAQDVFREQIRTAKKIGDIRTLYASEYDRAILISESWHRAPRAGSGGDNILVAGGVESVDTRLSGHSYVFDEPKAIQDFSKIVNRETAAPERGLPEREKAGAPYWVIEP